MINSSIFDIFMLPLEITALDKIRRILVPRARGQILEIGSGTGVNLRHYVAEKVEKLYLTDMEVSSTLKKKTETSFFDISMKVMDAQNIEFPDESFDTVVSTLVFCSVPDPEAGFREIARVLKPGGELLFIEHVLSSNTSIAGVQHRLTPLWKKIAGNCHLNRETEKTLATAGFHITKRIERNRGIFLGGIAEKE